MILAKSSAELEELLRTYRPRVASFIVKIVRDSSEVDDLTQETLMRVARSWENFRGESALSSWILQIASNVCADYYRRKSARPQLSNSEKPLSVKPAADNLTKGYENKEMGECIINHIDSLPESYRKVLIRHDMEGLKMKSIAQSEGVSENSVKVRLHRARKKLRAMLESNCVITVDGRNLPVCDRK